MGKIVQAGVRETSFNCPHCGSYAAQQWYSARGEKINLPSFLNKATVDLGVFSEAAAAKELKDQYEGLLFARSRTSAPVVANLVNLFCSECHACNQLSIWAHDKLIFPRPVVGEEPNDDLDPDIKRDYLEARLILDVSPRGAAALLRLCLQKLCKQLGEGGQDINKDIASLAAKGLDGRLVMALDIVRVVGNESVHPGVMDLRDDRETALELLVLINIIADQLISRPKAIEAAFNKLPEEKRKAAEERNRRAREAVQPLRKP